MARGGERSSGPAPRRLSFEIFRGSLAGRFSLMFLALLIPLFVVGLTLSRGISSNANALLEARLVAELAAHSLALVYVQDDVTKEILLNVDRISEADRKIEAYDENRAVLARIAELSHSADVRATVHELERLDEDLLRPLDTLVLEALTGEGPEAALQIYFSRYQPVRREYQRLSEQLASQAHSLAVIARTEMETRNRSSTIRILAALSAGIALVALIMSRITRDIRKRLGAVVGVLEAMANRDLRRELEVDSDDEIGRIAKAVNRAVSEIGRALAEVAEATNELEMGVIQISRATESVANRAAEHGAEVKSAAGAMEQATAQIWEIAESARSLRVLVGESGSTVAEVGTLSDQFQTSAQSLGDRIQAAGQAAIEMSASLEQVQTSTRVLNQASRETTVSMSSMARAMTEIDETASASMGLWGTMVERGAEGRRRVQETIEGVGVIREVTEVAASMVNGFGTRAEEIDSILDVIGSVAEETNLLALNASIIAAQSGESGRAFAVVADQIGNLASRVSTHTKEIEVLVRSVQGDAAKAVAAIGRGEESVARVVGLSSEAGAVVDELTRSSQESASRLEQIAQSVQDQARAAQRVLELMTGTERAVAEIDAAVARQGQCNELVASSTDVMSQAADRICSSTGEQSASISRIGQSVEGVRVSAEAVENALQEQTRSIREMADFLDKASGRSGENARSAELTNAETDRLRELARALRARVQRFSL